MITATPLIKMEKVQNGRIKSPIAHWLFLLFLTAGLSDFAGFNFAKNQVYSIETVDSKSGSKHAETLSFYSNKASNVVSSKINNWITTIKFLSEKSSRLTKILLIKHTVNFQSFAQRLAIRFLLTKSPFTASEHSSSFIF